MKNIKVYEESAKVIEYYSEKHRKSVAKIVRDMLDSYIYEHYEEFLDYINYINDKCKDTINEDRFFLDGDSGVLWTYRNFDADSLNQVVENYFSKDLLLEALTKENPFEWIETFCKQYCIDVNDKSFSTDLEWFSEKPFAIGCTEETLNKLKEALL